MLRKNAKHPLSHGHAIQRASRGVNWERCRGDVEVIQNMREWLAEHSAPNSSIRLIGRGTNSSRDLVAKFEDDPSGLERLKYHTLIQRGHADWKQLLGKYPDPDNIVLPAGIPLTTICQSYPRHVCGSGLRTFLVPGWYAAKISSNLLQDVQNQSKAAQRPHNAMQKAMTKEVQRMHEEQAEDNEAHVNNEQKDESSSEQRPAESTLETRSESTEQPRSLAVPPIDLEMMNNQHLPETQMNTAETREQPIQLVDGLFDPALVVGDTDSGMLTIGESDADANIASEPMQRIEDLTNDEVWEIIQRHFIDNDRS